MSARAASNGLCFLFVALSEQHVPCFTPPRRSRIGDNESAPSAGGSVGSCLTPTLEIVLLLVQLVMQNFLTPDRGWTM